MTIAMLILALLPPADLPVTVTTKDGKTVKGTVAMSTFKMKTSFGEVTFETDKVDAIQFGEPDLVTTSDETKLRGKIQLDELKLKSATGPVALKREQLASLFVDRGPQAFLPGKIVDGKARNNVTYCARVPEVYDAEQGLPAIVILHGSNMNAKAYVSTIVGAWPKLAEEYILIGVNGEYRVPNSPADNPAFNYSGVNFVGQGSKYKGFPGTDRESPALVPEVIAELKERLNVTKVFLGGHSQGGFVTYSVFMNFPELIAGAFPISAGPWIQCEPAAYDNADVRALQRRVAVAIIHGENDPVVGFDQGRAAHESFDDDGFPALRFFTDKAAGHMFARLPVEPAIRWLERMSSDDPAALVRFAEQRLKAGEFRDASAALVRARSLDNEGEHGSKIESLENEIDKAAEPQAKKLAQLIAAVKDDTWVRDFFKFRTQFQFASASRGALDAYRKLRAEHEEPATKLWNESRQDFQSGKQDAGYAKYQEIVKKYYASSWYRYAMPALENRPPAKAAK